ncbi:MAG: hypothetical protein LBU14_01560 [Candidatus Peribacteria bacterium]|nr:hypothetical protein [Candidatus Peribacteria bacterium]
MENISKEFGELEKIESLEKESLAHNENTEEIDVSQESQTMDFNNMLIEDIAKLNDSDRVLA